jgi:hypothetical protein
MSSIDEMFAGLGGEPALQSDPLHFFVGVVMSIVVSMVVVGLYRVFYSRPGRGSDMQRAFLLLGPSITALFIAIQFSIPLALGLFGVFAIVRFRNPVRDPEEIGFLMLLLACAVICATLQFKQLLIFLLLVTLALVMRDRLRMLGQGRKIYTSGLYVLTLTIVDGGGDDETVIATLEERVPDSEIQSVSYADGIMTIHCRFKGEATLSAAEVSRIVEEVATVRRVDIYYAESGEPSI